MKLMLVAAALLSVAAYSGTLHLIPDGAAEADLTRSIVYRTSDHVIAYGTVSEGARVLSDDSRGLEEFALVTVRNNNGVLQATELGEIVYRDGRSLILKLHRPLSGDFIRSGVFNVRPLRETSAPAEPITIPYREGYDDAVADIVAAVSEDSLISITTNYENYVTRYSNADGYDTACIWSNDRFSSYGLDSDIRHFSMLSYDCQNVIATQTGTVYPDQYWIICGHLDSTSPVASTNAPGADDNGSGSAAVMEAARIMSQYNFEYTVRYCLWGGEEQGLYGSAHYADSAAAAGDQILGVVNLDMIFYGPTPDDIAELHYNTASQGLGLAFDAISDTYVPVLQKSVANPPVSASDHSSFWNAGYPAMLSIEKEVWNNPYYHQTTDIMANYLMYFPFGTNMAKAAIATVAYLAVPEVAGIEESSEAVQGNILNVSLQENPVASNASLNVNMPSSGTASIQIYDTAGRQISVEHRDLSQGSNQLPVDTAAIPSGMYIIRVSTPENSASTRMMLLN